MYLENIVIGLKNMDIAPHFGDWANIGQWKILLTLAEMQIKVGQQKCKWPNSDDHRLQDEAHR